MAPTTAPASPRLQSAIARACRVLAVVARLAEDRRRDGPPRTRGELWLCGRASEIEALVAAVFHDRASRVIDDDDAARHLEGYAETLEQALRALFGGRSRRAKSEVVRVREQRTPT